jgi:hypothetical protein
MSKMLGIFLIGIGLSFLLGGIWVLTQTSATQKPEVAQALEIPRSQQNILDSLSLVISTAMMDGMITPKEEISIREYASQAGENPDQILRQIKQDLEDSSEESETELIDKNQKAGYDFEKFIVAKFNKKYFSIQNWASDKFVDGRYAEANLHPDIQLTLKLDGVGYPLAVECKWRKEPKSEFVQFAEPDQLKRYQEFETKSGNPVFIALGIGGKPSAPKSLYIIPIQAFQNPVQHLDNLSKYKKDIDKLFFYDQENQILR